MSKSYDELLVLVNEKYKTEKNMRKIASEVGISFSEVFEMIGYKDYFDFYEEIEESEHE